jgi:4-hydroxythreonine-4-phosphate dehydrogenase
MSWTVKRLALPVEVKALDSLSQAQGRPGAIDMLDLHNLEPPEVTIGQIGAAAGRAAMEYVTEAVRLASRGEVGAIVTAPLSKEAARLAGYSDMGHMELFARLTGTKPATMLMAGPLRVVHLSTHRSLREACLLVTKEAVLDKILLTHRCFEGWGVSQPRIGVAALNPHGGEGGLLGDEEIKEIAPAVEAARGRGINAQGPVPADSLFVRAIRGEFDVTLAMYHDQGHIPMKTFCFERSVSVALGLPFIRTSVDHGTAFDIAGKGIASPDSLVEAIKVASYLALYRKLPGT